MNNNIRRAISRIEQNKLWYKILGEGKTMISAQDVEEIVEKPEEIFKTIIMVNNKEQFFAAFNNGRKMIDLEKVRKVLHSGQLRLAKASELKQKMHLAPGEVCPLLVDVPIVFDKDILNLEKVNFGSGDVKYGIEMKTKDLINLIKPRIEDISE
jgi:prolyl-tRNA editing enzyme YbaK/EbsC (Cys-tRNA(Pro) deacylase)